MQKEKNLRKATRFSKEIQLLKRAKKHELIQFVVFNEKTFEELAKAESVNSVAIDLKMRAFVRAAQHEKVKGAVAEFKDKFPDWKTEVPEIVEILAKEAPKKKKRRKKKKKKVKSKETKPSRTLQTSHT